MNAWKYLLTIPILGLFLMGFNTEKVFIEIDEPTDLGNVAQSKASTQLNNFYESIVLDDITTNKAPTKQTKASTTKSTNKESSKLPEDISTTLINKNTSDTELDNITKRLKKEGLTVKFKGVKRNKNGEITAIKITAKSKNSNASYNVNSDEAIDTIKIIYDEDNNSISIGNGKARHDKNTFVHETQEGGKYKIQKSGSGSNVFLISDEDVELNEGDKGETKIIVRGKGKNGKVKKIKRSKNIEVISGDDDTVEIIVDGEGNDEKEVIIVNGKVEDFTEEEDKVIVKGNSIWVSKSDDNDEDITIIKSNKHKNKIFISGDNGKDPLYIIDGKEVPKEKITDLDPDKIESMTVLKDKSAVEKYGDKGKNGVIIIKTKKN